MTTTLWTAAFIFPSRFYLTARCECGILDIFTVRISLWRHQYVSYKLRSFTEESTAIICLAYCSLSLHYSSALKPIQRMHHGQTAPTGLEAVCLSKITSWLSAFPPSFIYNSAPKLHVRRRPVCSHEILRGRWKIGGCSKPPQQPASCWCTEEERWDGPSLWSFRPLAPNPLILLSFLRLFFFFFFPISSAEVVCVSPCYFAALLSLDSRLISIQHLCWHKKATHWLLFFFFFFIIQTQKRNRGGREGEREYKRGRKGSDEWRA